MNYYSHEHTQHIIQIIPEEDATVENYKRIAKVLECFNDIHYNSYMLIHDGIMDDSTDGDNDGWCDCDDGGSDEK